VDRAAVARAGEPSLRPVAAAFVCFGAFWGSWAVAAIDVERFLRVSHAGLGSLVAAAVVGGTVSNAFGGTMAERVGTRRALAACLVAWAVLLAGLAATHQRWPFMALFVVTVAAGGGADVVMNVAASAALSSTPGRLLRFHSLFNAGAVGGAATTAILVHQGVTWRAVWIGIAVFAVALAFVVMRTELHAGEGGEHISARDGLVALKRAGLVGLAVVFALGAAVEGGIDTWGVLFLRSRLAFGVLAGAAAYVAGQTLATGARASIGGVSRRVAGGRGATFGAGIAAVGLLVEALAPWPAAAGVGLAVAAVGVSMCWPLFLAEATSGDDRPAVIVGGITAAGYIGFLAGPPVVGWIASAWSLRAGLIVLAGAAALAATLPRHRRTGRRDVRPGARLD
jgi:hypothetical protein